MDNGGCEHTCMNTEGNFSCSCNSGYELDSNGFNCSGKSLFTLIDVPILFFTDVNECLIGNGGCEHNCTNTAGNFSCSCDIGYSLDNNLLNCSDVDECNTDNGGCEHTCTNTVGNFSCSCNPGYLLEENSFNCSGQYLFIHCSSLYFCM